MWRKYLKPVAVVVILLVTVLFFIHYFATNSAVRHQLSHLSFLEILLLLALYSGTIVALTLVNTSTLRLCDIKGSKKDGILLSSYAAVVNFFGPLQSGPAVRAVYLKKKYSLNLKKYTLATICYYFFWALFSGLFLLSGVLGWWLVPLTALGLIALYFVSRHSKIKPKLAELDLKAWYLLALATLLQIVLVSLIYFSELHTVSRGTTYHQALIYTGAANFALFVSITPGAIGFREAFLVFSKHLHHISTSTIVAANIIDRSVYIIFLILLAILITATHASSYLGLKSKS